MNATKVNIYSLKSDEDLMQAIAQHKDIQAFDELYERYHQKMLHYFYRMLGYQEEKAQDFLQDLFVKVIEKPHLFDTARRFSTWIFTIAHNMCKNEYRRLKVRRNSKEVLVNGFDQAIVLPEIDRKIDSETFEKELYQLVDELDDRKRNTFLLRYQEDCSIKEISEIMACSEGTVKSRLFYTTKLLAERLQIYNPKKETNG